MGRKKKLLRRTINFGEVNNPARKLVEEYLKLHGGRGLSECVRKLVLTNLSKSPSFDEYKIKTLKKEYKLAGHKVALAVEEKQRIGEQLRKFGIDPDDLILED